MLEVKGDLWGYRHKNKVVRCITTNGFIKHNGLAVMGRGTASQAAYKYPNLSKDLAEHIRNNGNVLGMLIGVGRFTLSEDVIITFPVKHKWWLSAELDLIRVSAESLLFVANSEPDSVFLLPKPGCGNGQLEWEDVKPVISFLPDNVLVIDGG